MPAVKALLQRADAQLERLNERLAPWPRVEGAGDWAQVWEWTTHHKGAVALALAWLYAATIVGPTLAALTLYICGWRLARSRMWVWHRERIWWLVGAVLAVEALTVLQALFGVTVGALGWLTSIAVTSWLHRDWLKAQHELYKHRKRWRAACTHAGLREPETWTHGKHPVKTSPGVDEPKLVSATPSATGLQLHLRLHSGRTTADVEKVADRLASWYAVRHATVAADPRNASTCTVQLATRDPFAGASLPWLPPATDQVSLWHPIALGVDEHGEPVTIELVERNLFLSGEPGAGKTNLMQQLVAAAALDPAAALVILDGKQIDLIDWQPRCEAFAGADRKDAANALKTADTWMQASYARLRDQGRKKVQPGDPLLVVVCDEAAYYLGAGKPGKDLGAQLRDLVQRGRAAGVIVIAATQRPSANVIPTDLRDLFSYRLALRCTTPQASDMSLGEGWAAQGYNAQTIPTGQRGGGFLLAEGSVPVRMRAYRIEDTTVPVIAAQAAELRGVRHPAQAVSPPAEDPLAAGGEPVGNGEVPTPLIGAGVGSSPGSRPGPLPASTDGPTAQRAVTAVLARRPPSFNVTNHAHWAPTAREKQQLEGELVAALHEARLPCPVPGGWVDVSAVLVVPDRRKRDTDNFRTPLAKALGDALQAGGWIPDDTPEHFRVGEVTFEVVPGSPGESRLLMSWREPAPANGNGKLSAADRRRLIEEAVRRDPSRSLRSVAEEFGCAHKTVGNARERIGLPRSPEA